MNSIWSLSLNRVGVFIVLYSLALADSSLGTAPCRFVSLVVLLLLLTKEL
jgi:hypothetical protein